MIDEKRAVGIVGGTTLSVALRRRWYLVAAGVVATCGLAFAANTMVPVSYQAKSSVLLLPPTASLVTGNNPYLALGGLTAAADVLARAMSNDTTIAELRGEGVMGSYSVIRDLSTNGPVILVTTTDSSATQALHDLRLVTGKLGPTMLNLQQGINVPRKDQIFTQVITTDKRPGTNGKSQLRAMLVALGGGVIMTVLLVSLADGFLMRRGARPSRSVPERPVRDEGAAVLPAPAAPIAGRSRSVAEPVRDEGAAVSPAPAAPIADSGWAIGAKRSYRPGLLTSARDVPLNDDTARVGRRGSR